MNSGIHLWIQLLENNLLNFKANEKLILPQTFFYESSQHIRFSSKISKKKLVSTEKIIWTTLIQDFCIPYLIKLLWYLCKPHVYKKENIICAYYALNIFTNPENNLFRSIVYIGDDS